MHSSAARHHCNEERRVSKMRCLGRDEGGMEMTQTSWVVAILGLNPTRSFATHITKLDITIPVA